jgi:hypothetical protein
MTINIADNTPRVSYAVAQGVTQSSFTVTFEFFDDEDLNVYVDGTLKTLTTDYTVTGGDGSTGSVSISVTGASGGSTVVITRAIALERTTDFPASGAFQIDSLNTELDRITAVLADINDEVGRSLRLTDYDTAVSLVLPDVNSRKGKVLAFNATSGAVESGPTIVDTQTVAAISADISTLADIEDGTDATDAIQTVAGISSNVSTVSGISGNVTTVAGISSNVTTVATNDTNITTVAGIDSDITTVAGISANVTTVANDGTDIGTVAGISANVTTVAGISSDVTTAAGISSDITTVAGDAADIATVASDSADIQSLAAVSSEIALLGVADVISDLNTLATSAIVTDMDALADLATELDALGDITANITTVAGISANVTTVAGISANTTTVAGISADVTTVAGISSNVTTVAGDSADIATVAARDADIATVAARDTDIGTVASSDTNIGTVATNITNVNTVASNISGVNSFGERYRVSATAPSTSLDAGDLWFDTTNNLMKVYGASGFVNAGSSVNGTSNREDYIVGTASGSYTGSTTDFPATYDAGFVDVYLNGVKLQPADFTATSGTNIVLGSAAQTNDTVSIVGYGTFELANFSIGDANNVDLSGLADDQILRYNSATSNFEAEDLPTGIPDQSTHSGKFLTTDGSTASWATVNTDLVDDTTPQLGGTLDTNGNAIQFGSSKWTIELDGNNLLFKYNGTAKIKFADDGEIVTVDDVTAFGTI